MKVKWNQTCCDAADDEWDILLFTVTPCGSVIFTTSAMNQSEEYFSGKIDDNKCGFCLNPKHLRIIQIFALTPGTLVSDGEAHVCGQGFCEAGEEKMEEEEVEGKEEKMRGKQEEEAGEGGMEATEQRTERSWRAEER